MKRNRNVKIVATLGPSSSDAAMIRALYNAGADVFRLNMSHGDHSEIRARHEIIRRIEKEVNAPIGILADLQGPKLRLGVFAGGSEEIEVGQAFRLDLDPTPGDATRVQLPHKEIFDALEPGAHLLVNDGKIRLKVKDCGSDFAECVVEVGGTISNRKGVNVPDVVLPLAALSEKDRRDLDFVMELGVDWVALSFVQRPADVEEARAIVQGRAKVLSKIEKPAAVNAFEDILAVSDGIMVARGDLGVELPVHAVPPIQKRLVRKCRAAAKPVIVATQMLESMITAPVPTRAEVSDVATAVYEGADAVMLSAESAAGQYPQEAVAQMNRIAEEVERDNLYWTIIKAQQAEPEATGSDAIAAAANGIAATLGISTIAAWTFSGATALRLARERPDSTILALTPKREAARRINLAWGIHAVVTRDASDVDDMTFRACKFAVRSGLARVGERIIVIAGVPFGTPGATNMIRIAFITEEHAAAA